MAKDLGIANAQVAVVYSVASAASASERALGRTRRVTQARYDSAEGDTVTLSAEARGEPASEVELSRAPLDAQAAQYRAAAKARGARDLVRSLGQEDGDSASGASSGAERSAARQPRSGRR